MNILFLSNLSGSLWNGPNNSVPAQIKAQSQLDNVFWFNYNTAKRKEWSDSLRCKNLQDIPKPCLDAFPPPFDKPDIVVVEEFYEFPFNKLIKEIQKNKIPYVIVPRSQMTSLAQRHKFFKKKIANILFFNKMVNESSVIEYLTEDEKNDSLSQWNKECIVIPNGIEIPEVEKKDYSKNCIKASYIGRVDVYQKGLDILLESISDLKSKLIEKNFSLTIYGPSQADDLQFLKKMALKMKIDDIVHFENSVFGEEKKSVLLNTDVFIMTSRFEGLPMGLIEALAYRIPCVATKGTNLMKEIADFDAGWVADNNIDSVKTALLDMVSTKNLAEKGLNAYNLAKRYSWNSIAKKTHDEYEKIINSNR
jgi:glycosyltransferase involved in cell wall biosynthesis